MPKTSTSFTAGDNTNLEHGQRSKRVGKAVELANLSPGQLERLQRIKGDLSTPEGRLDAMNTLAANSFDLEEWGIAWLRHHADEDGVVATFENPILTRHISIHNTARADLKALDEMALAHAQQATQTLDELLGVKHGND